MGTCCSGLDSSERKALIERFRHEDGCRAFLSTDAGGVGLNLQHASVVVNMDVPWNPAVLEQRIGRVHRMKIPMPSPEMLNRALEAIGQLLWQFRR